MCLLRVRKSRPTGAPPPPPPLRLLVHTTPPPKPSAAATTEVGGHSPAGVCAGSTPSQLQGGGGGGKGLVCVLLSPVRPTLPTFLSEDPPEDASPSPHTHSAHTPAVPAAHSRQADWLLREYPYSEGVAEHKRLGTCWDCLRFHGDGSADLPVSGSGAPAPGAASAPLTLASA